MKALYTALVAASIFLALSVAFFTVSWKTVELNNHQAQIEHDRVLEWVENICGGHSSVSNFESYADGTIKASCSVTIE